MSDTEDQRKLKIGLIKPEDLWNRALQFQFIVTFNKTISLKNKSLLLLIETYDGKITIEEILKYCPDGKSKISSGLKELEEIGAIEKIREKDEAGKWLPTRYKISLYTPENIEKALQKASEFKKEMHGL